MHIILLFSAKELVHNGSFFNSMQLQCALNFVLSYGQGSVYTLGHSELMVCLN